MRTIAEHRRGVRQRVGSGGLRPFSAATDPRIAAALRVLAAALGLIVAVSGRASAQIGNQLAIGASVTTRVAGSTPVSSGISPNVEARWGHDERAWGWQVSLFDWFDTDVARVSGIDPGRLRVRPIMAGYGRTWSRGRTLITADLLAGLAINSYRLDPAAQAEYVRLSGGTAVAAEASNTFAVKPELQLWYDLNGRWGFKIDGGYLLTRPTVNITAGPASRHWDLRADTVLVTVGLVYSIM